MKKLAFYKGRRTPSEAAGLCDIDITPVMNVFVILIPYLISMAVFTHLAVVDFSLPPNVGANLDASAGKPIVKLTVVVTPEYLAITQGENMLDSLPGIAGDYPYATFRQKLIERRDSTEVKDEVIIAARDGIKFKYLVRVMDNCRAAGFQKLGLSDATANPEGGS
jgi:biopolymer transport protein ExbD